MTNNPPGLCLARYAMGTRFEAVLLGDDEVNLRAAGEAALDEIEDLSARLDLFKKNSFVCHLNRNAFDAPVRVDADLFDLLRLCRQVSRASEGAFDITVGSLMECWGFHGRSSEAPDGSPAKPVDQARARAMDRVGFERIELDRESQTVRFLKQGMRLDFGAVAKGFALDRAREILEEAGIDAALIHGGTSTIMALGAPAGSFAWPVGIQDPHDAEAMVAQAKLCNRALSVSAPHGRSIQHEGRLLGHVMNIADRGPARNPLSLAAVAGTSAALADAWSTAFVSAGAGRIEALVKAANLEAAPISVLSCMGREDPAVRRMNGPETQLFTDPDNTFRQAGE